MIDTIDITAKQQKTLLAILRRFIPGVAVWAYGSRVKWTARPNSDLDLVAFTRPEQQPLVSELEEALAESDLPFLVDFHVWAEVPKRFHEIIRKQYVVLQEEDKKQEGRGMAGKWSHVTLGDVVTLQRGLDLPSQKRRAGQVPIISSSGISGYHSEVGVAGPGVVTGRYGTIGQVFFVREDYWPLNTTLWVKDFHGNDPRFVSYLLRTVDFHSCSDKSSVPGVNRNDLHRIPVLRPSLPEQRAIAGVLGALDDKIESDRRTSRTLEKLARATFRAWFVDFEPAKAKAAGARSFPGMPQDAFDALPARLVPSPLGPIPEGWSLKPLSDLCTLGRGASPRPINDYMNGEVPWVKIADATAANGPFLFDTKERLKTSGVAKSVKVSPGDLILSNSATCGLPIFVEFDGCIHDGWLYFKNLRSVSKTYLFHILIELSGHLVQIADGSVQKNLNTKLVGAQTVLVPPQLISTAFDSLAVEYLAKMRLNGLESRSLAAMRDYLLPKILSGEVRVATSGHVGTEDM